ncbi:hypothetical protein BO71DRAFT_458880 [Aspergillus ellipticus CBS 707.79]|uniref:Mitochondrial division protein 1 n=1 Tax=Aspergillus ellipticus CBS 707.79 TaxID=1448320 RepID=A0A319ELM5_9EURO|nr:hypothetical protein BO71DRAFT_458880 [Aspergillus ellipticus CBS 707.79]
MAQNHQDHQAAFFESSEVLADALARCSVIEKHHRSPNVETSEGIDRSIVALYGAILEYTAGVVKVQNSSRGTRVRDMLIPSANSPLSALKSAINDANDNLGNWTKLDAPEDAIFGSYGDQNQAKCLPNTRVGLLKQIIEWTEDRDGKNIFWLCGMAGTGKSTISRSVAALLKQNGTLGASFFFNRNDIERSNAKKFCPTIAFQLMAHLPETVTAVRPVLEKEPWSISSAVRTQFKDLIHEPLAEIAPDYVQGPVVFVIDALDECESPEDVDIRAILSLLSMLKQIESVKIKILITSRPELPIREAINKIPKGDYEHLVLQDISPEQIKLDLGVFLRSKFDEIKSNRADIISCPDWPGENTIEALTERAFPLFIFASTICRFVADESEDPEERLSGIMELYEETGHVSHLDETYRPVLSHVLKGKSAKDRSEIIQVLIGTIITLAKPLSLNGLAELINWKPKRISLKLKYLHSVLNIPNDPDSPITTLHLSFRDYLTNPIHHNVDDVQEIGKQALTPGSGAFCVDEEEAHLRIAFQCIEIMNAKLHRYQENAFSSAVQYSCLYWVHHLEQSRQHQKDTAMRVHEFLKRHLLHWLDALSILSKGPESAAYIRTLVSIFADEDSDFANLLLDINRFLLQNMPIIESAPLQLYSGGLIFTPETSIVKATFPVERMEFLPKPPQVEKYWGSLIQTIEDVQRKTDDRFKMARKMAISANGKIIADYGPWHEVDIWDLASGLLRHSLKVHSPESVTLSADGNVMASSSKLSYDISLWDTATGIRQCTIKTMRFFDTVMLSPDGTLLASRDFIWDVATGSKLFELETKAFSPDGTMIVSLDAPGLYKVMNTESGIFQYSIHSQDTMRQFVFSPDGILIAAISSEEMVSLWDARSGVKNLTLDNHTEHISCVELSPDSDLIALGSWEDPVKIWGTSKGDLRYIFMNHAGETKSLSFSSDGKIWDIATGAAVKAIALTVDRRLVLGQGNMLRVWDMALDTPEEEVHSSGVDSVAISQDGTLAASGAQDGTLKLWDIEKRTEICQFEGHTRSIHTIAFSPDHRMLWDTTRGAQLRDLQGLDPNVTLGLRERTGSFTPVCWAVASSG